MNDLFLIRAYRPESDEGFARGSWLYSNRYSPRVHGIPTPVYHKEWLPLIANMIARSRILVAHAPDNEDALLGFSCVEASESGCIVHHVYVKRDARRLGIAKALLGDIIGPVVYTHLPVVRGIIAPSSWTYNCELIWKGMR